MVVMGLLVHPVGHTIFQNLFFIMLAIGLVWDAGG